MKEIGFMAVVAAALVVGTLWKAYVLTILWAWFMVGQFNAPALSIPSAIGVSLVVSLLTASSPAVNDTRTAAEKTAAAFSFVVIFPALILRVGVIAKQWL